MDAAKLEGADLAHYLKNVEQEKLALQSLLKRAADEIDQLAEADCDPDAIAHAEKTAARLRRAGDA